MKRHYKIGANRHQTLLLPPSVDEYVSQTNMVRALDVYVDTLNLAELQFTYTDAASGRGGQPSFAPEMMLKLYLYGYMNRIRSSRRLERETRRNLELMWLIQGLDPSHAAIANFRKDNLEPLKKVNRDFINLCRELDLFGGEEVGIDGSFMHGNDSKSSIYTQEKLQKQLEKLNQDIESYLADLARNDQIEIDVATEDKGLLEKIEQLKTRQTECKGRLAALSASGEKQYSQTDPDARLLRKRGQTVAGYNVQIVVDSKHKLIACHEVVNDGNDSQQLAPMSIKAKEVLRVESLVVNADAGYDNREQLKQCVDAGITPYVPLADKEAQVRQAGRFARSDFTFDADIDSYRCPAGQWLIRQGSQEKDGKLFWKYVSKASSCAECPLRKKCLPGKTNYRQIYHWEHEEVINTHKQRMAKSGREQMKIRASLAEHPFGTMKNEMGWRHFLMRGFDKVRAEMSLQVWSYNFKRVLNIVGFIAFKEHLEQRVTI